ncbi:MAG: DUF1499 domain-containing protein [Gammaproteobacteria bacterium]|jgi:uncharacterized protein (DUF1499 family)
MRYIKPNGLILPVLGLVTLLSSMICAATEVNDMTKRLESCPGSPNCVSSDDSGSHGIPPLQVAGESELAWTALVDYLEQAPEFTIIENTGGYLRAEARTRILRFVDDVEFLARPEDNTIAMRSASRVGYSDLGANRRRLEGLRSALVAAGVVRSIE